MFMRDGTPSGLRTMSTGVPSAMNGMSSTGTMSRGHALVAVAAGHLVAGLDATLHREVHLDHLEHARGRSSPAVIFERFSSKAALELLSAASAMRSR